MLGGRARLPVLAEISGLDAGGARPWSLRENDFERLGTVRRRLGERRVVLVTGAAEPIRAAAVALAGVCAAAGLRTALLDADLAQPRLAAELGLAPGPGLHEYLRWEATPAEVLQPLLLTGPAAGGTGEPLAFIAAGRQAYDPATLLGLQSFRHMAAKLRGAYDLFLIAGPAIAGEGDGGLPALATEADSLLAALAPEQRSGGAGRALRTALRRLPAPPLGAVVVG